MSLNDFRTDRRTSYAVVRCLETISEASRRLPAELKARHPAIPWTEMAGAGSVYRHQYHVVQDEFVWQTIHHDLESLRIVEQELERLEE
jgi:uncharacterized protein with HEPN domain